MRQHWFVEFQQAIGWLGMKRARRQGQGWLMPREVLQDVHDFCRTAPEGVSYKVTDPEITLEFLKAGGDGWTVKRQDAISVLVEIVLEVPTAYKRRRPWKGCINSLEDLRVEVGARAATVESIASALDGVHFWTDRKDPQVVLVAGCVCWADDAECQSYELQFPFGKREFWRVVDQAEQDGEDLYNENHDEDGNRLEDY